MARSFELAPPYQTLQVSAKLEPSSAQSVLRRSRFLASAMGLFSVDLLENYIKYCRLHAKFPNSLPMIPAETKSEATKELICVSLLLTLAEQDERNSLWLKAFFRETWKHTDDLYASPIAYAVLEKYGNFPIADLCQITSLNLCHQLDLGLTVDDASLYLGEHLEELTAVRSELLFFALSGTEAELTDYLATA